MTTDKLPPAYINKYGDPDLFNMEYSKYVHHINADVDESSEGGDPDFQDAKRLDFYNQDKDRDEDEREDDDDNPI